MATSATLSAQKREGTGKGVARKLRAVGRVPAVLYGRELEPVHLSLDTKEAEQLFHSISVDNTIVDLVVEGEKEAHQTLIREVQVHPSRQLLIHVDFLRIQEGVRVDVNVPVHLLGIPEGVKNSGGVLEQIIHDLPVRCIPSKIPKSIDVDVTHLDLNESLHVYDMEFEEGVEVTIEQGRTICSVAIPKVIEEPEEEEELLEGEELEGKELEEGAPAAEGADEAEDSQGDGG
jgi:large subunit ribosomal protein L25